MGYTAPFVPGFENLSRPTAHLFAFIDYKALLEDDTLPVVPESSFLQSRIGTEQHPEKH